MKFRSRGKSYSSLGFEKLEDRKLLSVNMSFDNGRLLIVGDDAGDAVNIRPVEGTDHIWVYALDSTGVVQQYYEPSVQVTNIEFWGQGGNDSFSNYTNLPTLLVGGTGADFLRGGDGVDIVYGQEGNDWIEGHGGDDFLVGGRNNDWIEGGSGQDIIGGRADNDVLLGGEGYDQIWGDDGNDWLDVQGAGEGNLYGGAGDDVLLGGSGENILEGGRGNDWIEGRAGNDQIFAGDGDDIVGGHGGDDLILGGAGNDQLWGDDGNDEIIAGFGSDQVTGGGGEDRIVFELDEGDNDTVFFGNDRASYTIGLRDFGMTVTEVSANGLVTDLVHGADSHGFRDGTFVAQTDTGVRQHVYVKPIVVSNDDGSSTAQFFGDAEQQQQIFDLVDYIFAGAGIDIGWYPTETWNDSFVNNGTQTSGVRDGQDLVTISNMGAAEGVASAEPTINMYFVEWLPGSSMLSNDKVGGVGVVGMGDSVMFIGDNVTNSFSDSELIARWVAIQIGMNLGIESASAERGNLFNLSGSGINVTTHQRDIMLSSDLSSPI